MRVTFDDGAIAVQAVDEQGDLALQELVPAAYAFGRSSTLRAKGADSMPAVGWVEMDLGGGAQPALAVEERALHCRDCRVEDLEALQLGQSMPDVVWCRVPSARRRTGVAKSALRIRPPGRSHSYKLFSLTSVTRTRD